MKGPTENVFIRVSEAYKFTGLSPEILKSLAKQGRFRYFITEGGQWRFHRESLFDYIRKLESDTQGKTISRTCGGIKMELVE